MEQIRISFQGKTQSFYYHPPEGLTESKPYAAAKKEAIRRRDYVQAGYTSKIPTFSSYAHYYISTKKTQNLRQSTLMQYKFSGHANSIYYYDQSGVLNDYQYYHATTQ